MSQIILALSFLIFCFQSNANESHKTTKTQTEAHQNKFGTTITSSEKVTLTEAINNFDQYKDKKIVFEAVTEKVCEQSGCWMVIKDGNHQVRTLFKDYGFFVPKDILGKKVRVQGIMEQKKISAATLRHFKKDEGAKLEDIKKIKTGKVDYQFTADAVEII